jgi:starch phosphorylase
MNLYNIGEYDTVKEILKNNGKDINELEQIPDHALGNGGLGRLAACFLDSAATKKIALNGYGIRYKYGIFKQKIENSKQVEYPDDWTVFGDPLAVKREEDAVEVSFKNLTVLAIPYDTAVIGYGAKCVNTLRLWEAKAKNEFNLNAFNNGLYDVSVAEKTAAESISAVLYPNDNTQNGKKLRLMQEYFFSSASIQDMLRKLKRENVDVKQFAAYFSIQLNDTHPAIATAELVRLLINEGVDFNFALNVAKGAFSYTNHTVMPEALEKFEVPLFKSVIPNLYPIIVKINSALKKELKEKGIEDPTDYLITDGKTIHMSRLCIYLSHSVNGVAEIHTQILKQNVLNNWYKLYPERFNNKTNGITQRRWLLLSNPELSHFITQRIGEGWITNLTELSQLKQIATDENISEFKIIKQLKKQQFSQYLFKTTGEKINPEFIFDTQVKRIHEYKRQFMNILSVLDTYTRLKNGTLKDFTPTAFFVGGKAAPGYFRAKSIINLILSVKEKIDADKTVNDLIKVVFLENYNVSLAEKIIPATEISQQISTAGTEASGTGNMKFMLNGAVTCGTLDGANIEIIDAAGEENNYIFGLDVEGVKKVKPHYNPMQIYEENQRIRGVVDMLIDGSLNGDFKEIYDSLLFSSNFQHADTYLVLADFISYCNTRDQINRDYKNENEFFKKCYFNTASAGRFSSDITVAEYNKDIWRV